VLEIEDDGRGLTEADQQKGRNGLRNMRKRMEDAGGQFEAGLRPNGGTTVRLTAPLRGTSAPIDGAR
jgi:signal transduction histidine kinase